MPALDPGLLAQLLGCIGAGWVAGLIWRWLQECL